MRVITWSDHAGNHIDICEACQAEQERRGVWLRNPATGIEYCQVSHGLHEGQCDLCQAGDDED